MKLSKYSEPQILGILRQVEGSVPVGELCREHEMSSALFYRWRSKYGGIDASMISQMESIENEYRRPRKMFTELNIQNELLKKALGKDSTAISTRKMAEAAVARCGVRIALACRTFGVSETYYRYAPRLSSVNEEISNLLIGLTQTRRSWAWPVLSIFAQCAGRSWNHKACTAFIVSWS